MALRERLIYVIDVVGDGATRGINSIKSAVANAQGTFGKLQAGLGALGINAGVAASAIGGALVGAGIKAVASTQALTLEIGKFADATGLSTDAASRLVEVSSDVGIQAGTIEAAIKKMNVEIGKGTPAAKEFGFELQRTADGAADVNATFLDTVNRINAIEDPTKRAAAAQAAFGRGYLEISDLIFQSADKLQGKLAEVSDQKIRTPEQIAQAREFRDSLADLRDNAEDLTIVVADGLVPILSDLSQEAGDAAAALRSVGDEIKKIPGVPEFLKTAAKNLNPLGQQILLYKKLADGVEFLADKWQSSAPPGDRFNDSILRGGTAAESAASGLDALGDAVGATGEQISHTADIWFDYLNAQGAATGSFAEMSSASDKAARDLEDVGGAAEESASALDVLANAARGVVDAVDSAFSDIRGDLDVQDLLDDITDQFAKIKEAQEKATDPEGIRNYNRSVRDLQRQLLRLLDDIDGIPPDKKVAIAAQIERSGVDELYRILGDLAKGVTVPVTFSKPQQGFTGVNVTIDPSAGTVTPQVIGANPAPVGSSTTYNYFPTGTSPTIVTVDRRIYDSRNQFDRTGIR